MSSDKSKNFSKNLQSLLGQKGLKYSDLRAHEYEEQTPGKYDKLIRAGSALATIASNATSIGQKVYEEAQGIRTLAWAGGLSAVAGCLKAVYDTEFLYQSSNRFNEGVETLKSSPTGKFLLSQERVDTVGQAIIESLPAIQKKEVIAQVGKIPENIRSEILTELKEGKLTLEKVHQTFTKYAFGLKEDLQESFLALESKKHRNILQYFVTEPDQQSVLIAALKELDKEVKESSVSESHSAKRLRENLDVSNVAQSCLKAFSPICTNLRYIQSAAAMGAMLSGACATALGFVTSLEKPPSWHDVEFTAAAAIGLAATSGVVSGIEEFPKYFEHAQNLSALRNQKIDSQMGLETMSFLADKSSQEMFDKVADSLSQIPESSRKSIIDKMKKGDLTVGYTNDIITRYAPNLMRDMRDLMQATIKKSLDSDNVTIQRGMVTEIGQYSTLARLLESLPKLEKLTQVEKLKQSRANDTPTSSRGK